MLTRISNNIELSGFPGQQSGSAPNDVSILEPVDVQPNESDNVNLSREAKSLQQAYSEKERNLEERYVVQSNKLERDYLMEKNNLEREYSRKKNSIGINTYA